MHLAVVVLPEGNSILVAASKTELLQEIQGELDILMPERSFDIAGLAAPGSMMAELDEIKIFLSEDPETRLGKMGVTHAILVRRLDETRSMVAASESDLMAHSGHLFSEWGCSARRLNPSEDVSILLGSRKESQHLRDLYLERQTSKVAHLKIPGRQDSMPETLCA